MKYDLLLTETGDLSFVSSNIKFKNEVFELNFHIAPTDSLCLKFNIDESDDNMIYPNKETKPSRIDREINTLDDLGYLENPKLGERIYIKDTKQLLRIDDVYPIMPIEDEEESITQNVVSKYTFLNLKFSGSLQYDFYIYTPPFDKIARTVRNKEYIQQSIKLRLSTELNTVLGNNDLGSNLHTYIHSNTTANKLLAEIAQEVKKSINDLLPNCEVHAYIINSDYLNYHDSIKIVIINNEETYYYYI